MKALQGSRWLARLVGCTTLTLGLAGLVVAGSAPAQARVTFPSFTIAGVRRGGLQPRHGCRAVVRPGARELAAAMLAPERDAGL